MLSRNEIQLTDEEIQDFLKTSKTIILVSNGKDGYPHPMPMWYGVDETNKIYCTTFRKSQKMKNLQRDPRVSLLVEAGEEYDKLKGVVIYTQAEIIDDLDATLDVMFRISVKNGDFQADQREAARSALIKMAKNRLALHFTPEKIISWDHSKL